MRTSPFIRYQTNDPPPVGETILFGFQYFAFFIANSAILPVIVGGYLGLGPQEIAGLLQRTFILCGVVSIIQVLWGHRFSVMEGPSGLWYGILIMLAGNVEGMGKTLALLRSDVEMGFIVAGCVCIVLGYFGVLTKIIGLFSPLVNGVFFILMSLQLSPNIINGILGISHDAQTINLKSFFVFIVTVSTILYISLKAKGSLQSLSILVGAGVGWLLAALVGIAPELNAQIDNLSIVPKLFAWGRPTFDLGIVLTFVIAAIVLFSNLIATINGMSEVTGEPVDQKNYNRGVFANGISNILAGIGAVIGFIPYGSAIGMTLMTGVASRRPFILGAVLTMALGFIPSLCAFFAAIPEVVGISVMFVVFCLILSLGICEFNKVKIDVRQMYVIGMSLLVGAGLMQLPTEALDIFPRAVTSLISNGLVVGVLMTIVLERLIAPKKSC